MKRLLLALTLVPLIAACGRTDNGHWLGYIEGETALIAPPQPGWITSVEIARGAHVKVGQPLFTLDAIRELAARDNALGAIAAAEEQARQATAQIAQAQAQQADVESDLERSQKELARQQILVQSGASPRRDLETAQAAFDSARARRNQMGALQNQAEAARRQANAQANQAKANLTTAEFNLSERTVHALVSGEVQDTFFRQGEYANAGVPVVSVLPAANVFVRFFVPETEIAQRRLGERVRVSCDRCPPDLVATISFIAAQAEFTPPVIYSVGNRERLVFKAEARVTDGATLPSRPGVPVEVWPADTASAESHAP
jgi:HlyD family secretion protein